jgi:hypothetical protein
MNNSTKLTLTSDANGATTISNERTTITIQPDGTVAISSEDPIQLTGATLAKLDNVHFPGQEPFNPYFVQRVVDALMRRLDKKR